MNTELLKLRAQDAEDMQVISAVLQDSIVPLCDMTFQPEARAFIVVAQRLRRETDPVERICCALRIDAVAAVQSHGIDLHQGERMLDLLAVMLDSAASSLNLIFASDARIRLSLNECRVTVEDFGQPWPALCSPCHEENQGVAS
jgi:hypothetical protein